MVPPTFLSLRLSIFKNQLLSSHLDRPILYLLLNFLTTCFWFPFQTKTSNFLLSFMFLRKPNIILITRGWLCLCVYDLTASSTTKKEKTKREQLVAREAHVMKGELRCTNLKNTHAHVYKRLHNIAIGMRATCWRTWGLLVEEIKKPKPLNFVFI